MQYLQVLYFLWKLFSRLYNRGLIFVHMGSLSIKSKIFAKEIFLKNSVYLIMIKEVLLEIKSTVSTHLEEKELSVSKQQIVRVSYNLFHLLWFSIYPYNVSWFKVFNAWFLPVLYYALSRGNCSHWFVLEGCICSWHIEKGAASY